MKRTWHNFNNLQYATDWLIARGLLSLDRTEEKDGPLAAGLNITDSIEKLLRRTGVCTMQSIDFTNIDGGRPAVIDIHTLADQAGFRVIKGEIIAADGGVSGAATQCVTELIRLVIDEAVNACWQRSSPLPDEKWNTPVATCATAVQKLKPK